MKNLYNKVNKQEQKQKLLEDNRLRTTLSFYKYFTIEDTKDYRDQLYVDLTELEVFGRIYIATEGINGQISLPTEKLKDLKKYIDTNQALSGMRLNIAIEDDGKSFYILKIKIKNKIVADGIEDPAFNPADRGKHLSAKEFNALTDNEETILIDMRNHYESEVGHFEKAITPDVETFRESLPIIEEMLEESKNKDIVMYCTGGIRCEKASAYLKHKGFDKVYQLDGGIIEYTREVEKEGLENKFRGKNFVFDDRMGERISEEVIAKCHQCGNSSDNHVNCANDACHILFIQCESCGSEYNHTCSTKCKDFLELDPEEQFRLKPTVQFNGTKFGKGRYKAFKAEDSLEE